MAQAGDNTPRGRFGFSLIEAMLVLTIIATVAAIAAPRYSSSISRYRAETAAQRVAADLAFARMRAMTSGAQKTTVFDTGADQYQILGQADLNDSSKDYVVKLFDKPYRSELVSADFGGDATVVFDGYGIPDSGGQVVVRAGHFEKTIVLDADSGKAEVQ